MELPLSKNKMFCKNAELLEVPVDCTTTSLDNVLSKPVQALLLLSVLFQD